MSCHLITGTPSTLLFNFLHRLTGAFLEGKMITMSIVGTTLVKWGYILIIRQQGRIFANAMRFKYVVE